MIWPLYCNRLHSLGKCPCRGQRRLRLPFEPLSVIRSSRMQRIRHQLGMKTILIVMTCNYMLLLSKENCVSQLPIRAATSIVMAGPKISQDTWTSLWRDSQLGKLLVCGYKMKEDCRIINESKTWKELPWFSKETAERWDCLGWWSNRNSRPFRRWKYWTNRCQRRSDRLAIVEWLIRLCTTSADSNFKKIQF